jgi:putative transposase
MFSLPKAFPLEFRRDDLRLAVITWIERTCHRRRRQRRPGKLTPIEYETISRAATAA